METNKPSRQKIWYQKNKALDNERSKQYKIDNKDAIREYNRIYKKNRRLNDKLFKLKENIRKDVNQSFSRSGYTKKSRTHEILGCSFEELKLYLESKFQPWMNWDNHGLYNGTEGYGWDIDHVIPLSSAKTEEELIKLNHYTNLQPLCSHINRNVKRATV
jgi:hypothetical protein